MQVFLGFQRSKTQARIETVALFTYPGTETDHRSMSVVIG